MRPKQKGRNRGQAEKIAHCVEMHCQSRLGHPSSQPITRRNVGRGTVRADYTDAIRAEAAEVMKI
jgi:hypothetical protein